MKKILLFLSLFLMAGLAKAGLFAGSPGTPDSYAVVYATYAASTISTTTVVVSLSSQTVGGGNIWPHPLNARSIVVDTIQIEVDKAAATTAGIKIGVVREVNESSGTVTWFDTCNSTINVSNTNPFQNVQYVNGGLDTRVNPVSVAGGASIGTTPWILSNDLNQAYTVYTSSTGTKFPSVISQAAIYRMQVGDIVAQIVTSAAANAVIQIRYHVATN